MILDLRFTYSITSHHVLHSFWAGYGTGISSIETKLIHQLSAMREEVLYAIFLYLQKLYGVLDRDRCLEILEGYDVGPQTHCILQEYWDRLWIVACTGGYYRTEFKGFQEVM